MTKLTRTGVDTMTAVVHDAYGDVDGLYLDRIVKPVPGKGEVRVRIRAVALNPADKFIMRGNPRMVRLAYGLTRPRTRVRGQDFAGIVDAVGEAVTEFAVGDEVFGEFDGTLAEYACGPVKHMAPMPSTLTFEQAAAIPMAAIAAQECLNAGKVGEGTRLLINGASGGIGTFAIQMAKARGAHVTAVCSTPNVDLVRILGADQVINYRIQPMTATADRFDVILDNVGNHGIRELLPLLRGRGVLMPNTGEPGPDGTALTRLITMAWHSLVTRHRLPMVVTGPTRPALEELGQQVADGSLTVVIDTMFDLEHAADAMARLATGHARGKVVVSVPDHEA